MVGQFTLNPDDILYRVDMGGGRTHIAVERGRSGPLRPGPMQCACGVMSPDPIDFAQLHSPDGTAPLLTPIYTAPASPGPGTPEPDPDDYVGQVCGMVLATSRIRARTATRRYRRSLNELLTTTDGLVQRMRGRDDDWRTAEFHLSRELPRLAAVALEAGVEAASAWDQFIELERAFNDPV